MNYLVWPIVENIFDVNSPRGGGGSSPIFVYECAILKFETPPLSKARQRQKFDPFVRQIWKKLTRKCLKSMPMM